MAKKKINQLDPGIPNLARLFAHADPATGKSLKGTLAQLVALFTSNTPVKSYADIDAMLANTDLVIGYLAFVADAGGDYGDPDANVWGLYMYNGPDADDLANYFLLATEPVASATPSPPSVTYADQAAMLANTERVAGQFAYVTSGGRLYIFNGGDRTNIANYTLLLEIS